MIVYQEAKSTFMDHVRESRIEYIIDENMRNRLGRRTARREVDSWRNSMQYMRNVLDDPQIPGDANVCIECQVPNTGKRIDFIIAGQDEDQRDCAVIVELKQWETAEGTDMDGIVRAFVGGSVRALSHPSYQAWSYASLLEGFNEEVYSGDIRLQPCAFLHNCRDAGPLLSPFYSEYTEKAPLFVRQDVLRLSEFIKRFVRYGDPTGIMYRIENGSIRPSKTIAEGIARMIDGHQEFVMVDDQKVVFEEIRKIISDAGPQDRRVVIVRGGPGTGKSVVAVQLTAQLTAERRLVQYVSKNSAPRSVYASRLTGYRSKSWVNNLFKGSGSYVDSRPCEFDALIVDEAHRLNERSGIYSNLGENQIKEIVHAAKCAVFFIDEDQRVTVKDIGTRAEIESWAVRAGATVSYFELESQFRCNGSDGYLAWLDGMFGIRETAHTDLKGIDYHFEVMDDPAELRRRITAYNEVRNRARIVAGYCWPWNSRKDPSKMDIVMSDYGFEMQWNLTEDGMLWIMSPHSVHQAGCIHTCQGLEVDYVGVIMGDDMVVRNGRWICRPEKRARSDKSIHGLKGIIQRDPMKGLELAESIIKNTYRTLMTRGMRGCLVFSTDAETRAYLRETASLA
ncbi:MAG: DUF2075 domain-containing protein [Chitinophagia bacterium]|nr:DUF2075 domain-containing protein [Chitinophagia bacterium]